MTLRVDVLTIFPDLVTTYAGEAILGRAASKGVWRLRCLDLRDATDDVHRSVDDAPFGGGAGMVMKPAPIVRTVRETADLARPLIFLSPGGRRFTQRVARELAQLEGFTLLCGRYEGVDQRAIDLVVDDTISLGDFVLAGGELAALCVIEAVVRLRPGALGNENSTREETFEDDLLEYPQYTQPAEFEGRGVPEVLRSGDHGRVERWRRAQAINATLRFRPDLIDRRGGLSQVESEMLAELETEGPEEFNG
jgi:tRNA (guanine37-N1)-methyltransferase